MSKKFALAVIVISYTAAAIRAQDGGDDFTVSSDYSTYVYSGSKGCKVGACDSSSGAGGGSSSAATDNSGSPEWVGSLSDFEIAHSSRTPELNAVNHEAAGLQSNDAPSISTAPLTSSFDNQGQSLSADPTSSWIEVLEKADQIKEYVEAAAEALKGDMLEAAAGLVGLAGSNAPGNIASALRIGETAAALGNTLMGAGSMLVGFPGSLDNGDYVPLGNLGYPVPQRAPVGPFSVLSPGAIIGSTSSPAGNGFDANGNFILPVPQDAALPTDTEPSVKRSLQELLDDLHREDAQADEQLGDAQQNFQLSQGAGPRNYVCTYGPCTVEEWEMESGVSAKKKSDDPCESTGGGLGGILAAAFCEIDRELAQVFDAIGSPAAAPEDSPSPDVNAREKNLENLRQQKAAAEQALKEAQQQRGK